MWNAVLAFLGEVGKGFLSGAKSNIAGTPLTKMGVGGTIGQMGGVRATRKVAPYTQSFDALSRLAETPYDIKKRNPKTGRMSTDSLFDFLR